MNDINAYDFVDVIGATAAVQTQPPSVAPLDYIVEDYTKRPKRVQRKIRLSKEPPSESTGIQDE